MLDTLSSTMDFDATYRRQQIQVHEAALKLHSDFAAARRKPDLAPGGGQRGADHPCASSRLRGI